MLLWQDAAMMQRFERAATTPGAASTMSEAPTTSNHEAQVTQLIQEIMTQTLRLAPGEADECADAPVPLDEFLVLGCDGIFDVKSNQEVVDFVRRQLAGGASEREACEALLDDCLSPDCGGSGVGGGGMSSRFDRLDQFTHRDLATQRSHATSSGQLRSTSSPSPPPPASPPPSP